MLNLRKFSYHELLRSIYLGLGTLLGIAYAATSIAVEARHHNSMSPTERQDEIWVNLPIRIHPIERLSVRDYKGAVQETYVSHPSSVKNLKIRASRSNDLYFGPWRFQVDASRMDRFGGLDVSVRVSHLDPKLPETYFDLGQQWIAGKVLRDGSNLRFITQVKGRFQNSTSPFWADVEFGVMDDNERRLLTALDFVSRDEFKNSPIQ